MPEKYDLNKMLEEIKEDERIEGSKKEKISQDKIKKMMMKRLKKPEKNNE